MMERERRREDARDPRGQGPGGGGNPGNQERRERADRLLRAGREAIDRALSHDSRQFIDSNRQRGGQ